jgi:hypothetical protein
MKEIAVILFVLILLSCGTTQTLKSDNNLEEFNNFLGLKKAEVLNQGVISFDNFLLSNYSDINEEERTRAFLEELLIAYTTKPDSNWLFNTKSNIALIELFETSGMRKEIIIYGYEIPNKIKEEEDIILIKIKGETEEEYIQRELSDLEKRDSLFSFNIYGKYFSGLSKFTKEDTLIQQYVEVRREAGNLPPSIIINVFLKQNFNYNNPFFKRILVADFYLDLIGWNIERSEK